MNPGRPFTRRLGDALQSMLFEALNDKVLRAAFLTIVLMAAIEQFVGWQYLGVFSKEAVFAIESRLSPWPDMPAVAHGEVHEEKRVSTLLIGNEYFADPDAFNHRVPLPAKHLLTLLTSIAEKAPKSLIAIDFDLSPRVEMAIPAPPGADPEQRRALDDWLLENAHRLVLVEPAWALRPGIVRAQHQWMKALCQAAPGATPALFVQSAIVSKFGVVHDQQALWDERAPAWDFGRGIADRIGEEPLRRNPLCAALLRLGANPPVDDAEEPDDLEVALTLRHRLPVAPQTMAPSPTLEDRLLRQEFLTAKACVLGSLGDVETSCESLEDASVVMLGGGWRFGYGDQHHTFVGDLDGALVHAAWIRSWLQPVEHLPLPLHILLDLIVIECFLNPVLDCALHELRRFSRWQSAAERRSSPGRGLTAMKQAGLLAAIVAAAAVSLLTLCLIDLSMRAVLGRTITVDASLLSLISWLIVNSYGKPIEKPLTSAERDEERREAIHAAAWMLGGACIAGLLLKTMSLHWPPALPERGTVLITCLSLLALAYFSWAVRMQMHEHEHEHEHEHKHKPAAEGRQVDELNDRVAHTWASVTASIARLQQVPRLLLMKHKRQEAALRLLDCLGLGLWLAVWLFSFWTLFRPQLYGLWATTLGG